MLATETDHGCLFFDTLLFLFVLSQTLTLRCCRSASRILSAPGSGSSILSGRSSRSVSLFRKKEEKDSKAFDEDTEPGSLSPMVLLGQQSNSSSRMSRVSYLAKQRFTKTTAQQSLNIYHRFQSSLFLSGGRPFSKGCDASPSISWFDEGWWCYTC